MHCSLVLSLRSAVSLFRDNEWVPEAWQTILMFWMVMVFSLLVNIWGVKGNYLELLNTASIYWSSASVIIILIVLLAMSGGARRSPYDALILWQNASGWTDGWSFFVGCLTPAYVLTGYGVSTAALLRNCTVHWQLTTPFSPAVPYSPR